MTEVKDSHRPRDSKGLECIGRRLLKERLVCICAGSLQFYTNLKIAGFSEMLLPSQF